MRKTTFLFLVFLAAVHGGAFPAFAQSASDPFRHCGIGEARSALQALEVGVIHWNPYEGEVGHGGLGLYFPCQYRLWATENPVTGNPWMFCEEDHFLAGTASLLHPQTFPFCSESVADCAGDADCPFAGEYCIDTNKKAFAVMERQWDTAQFGPVAGPLEEQTMIRTATRHAHDPESGNIVWYQSGFIVHRKPGQYRSVLQSYFDGMLIFEETALVEIVSHQEHVTRVINGTWK